MNKTIQSIMKREKWSAERLSTNLKISAPAFRRMLRGDTIMPAEIYAGALDEMGYKLMIVKKEDIV